MELLNLNHTKLNEDQKKGLSNLLEALFTLQKENFCSAFLYGSSTRGDFLPNRSDINLMLVFQALYLKDLQGFLNPMMDSRSFKIEPFMITECDLFGLGEVFPMKLFAIKENYLHIWGTDSLKDLVLSREKLLYHCNQEINNIIMRLKQQYLRRNGIGITEMILQLSKGLPEVLKAILFINLDIHVITEDVIKKASEVFNLPYEDLRMIRSIKAAEVSLPRNQAEELLERFMAVLEKIRLICHETLKKLS